MTEFRANILVVDDSRQTRLTLTKNLEAQGHVVSAVDSGRAALETLATGSFDLILLDILMPDVDGFEVLRKLKEDDQKSDIPVIVVSALEDRQSEEKCKQLGAQAFITKPIDTDELDAKVVACLGQGN